jgi:hypothetical protein
MPEKKNNKKKPVAGKSYKVKDYGNDPFVLQKAETARKTIEKYGLPKQLQTVKK